MKSSIRILHVIGIMNRGRAETMLMNLYRHMDRDQIQFDFVENTMEKADYDDEIKALGGRIYHCPHYKGINHYHYKKWWKEFFQNHNGEYRIIHGHIGSAASIYLGIAKRNGMYTIAHSHSSGMSFHVKDILYRLMTYNTRYIADYYLACSDAAGKDRYGKGILNKENYSVINNAIDTELF